MPDTINPFNQEEEMGLLVMALLWTPQLSAGMMFIT